MAEWPLVGRERELTRLRELLADPASAGAILSGPQGVGKTRLALEFLRIAENNGFATERIMATHASSTMPLGALALSVPFTQTLPGHPEGTQQAEMVHRVAQVLTSQAGKRLVLLVDDVHLLDRLSSVLVQQLAVSESAFVVLTMRSGAVAPDSIVSLWKNDILQRIPIGTVAQPVVRSVLETVLGGTVADAAVDQLTRRSDGNLLFLREQVIGALDDGALTDATGIWQLNDLGHTPRRLAELIESRLRELTTAERALLELVAFGEPLDLDDLTEDQDIDDVEALEGKGLLKISPDGRGGARVVPPHPIYGEVLRSVTSVIRARKITRTLAERMEARTDLGHDDLLRIATWRLTCGGGSAATMLDAAHEAHRRFDYELARRFASAALTMHDSFEARLLIGRCLGFEGRREDAELALSALAEVADNDDQRAAVANARIVNAHFQDNPRRALTLYDEAIATIVDPGWRVELSAKRSMSVWVVDGPKAALDYTDALPTLHGAALVTGCITRAIALARAGRSDEALTLTEIGRTEQARLPSGFELPAGIHDFMACEAFRAAGRIADWDRRARTSYQRALTDHSLGMQVYLAYQTASVNLDAGAVRSAQKRAREAIALGHQLAEPILLAASYGCLAEALAAAGAADDAAAALSELDRITVSSWPIRDLHISRAWVTAAAGDLPTARDLLIAAADRAAAGGDLSTAANALHGLARLGRPNLAEPRLAELAEHIDGHLAATQAAHVKALCAKDTIRLERVAIRFEDLGLLLLAAEAHADRSAIERHHHNHRAAAGAERLAAALALRCEGARTPALQAIDNRARLTPAERDTALLAAQGHSNKTIACRQHISLRTVESRLKNVYAKLGINSRSELKGALTELT